MIVVRQKPLEDICRMVAGHRRVLLAGCNTCAAVALAGGESEVRSLQETLSLAMFRKGANIEFAGTVVQRQCEPEFIEALATDGFDAVLSLGCGAGVALLADSCRVPIYPGLDTLFIGASTGLAQWRAECSACGSCVLGETAGICPVTRCAKGIMNGPCGGVEMGRCELGDRDCAWVLIHERLESQGDSERLGRICEPRDNSVRSVCEWSAFDARGGGR